MKIVVDENIVFGREAFSFFGDVVLLPAREITRERVKDAEVLCVRSPVRVDRALIDGTAVKYVATPTIGSDHLDKPYLDSVGIQYGHAPGCNADSVADYISAALLSLAQIQQTGLEGKTLGVVGCGNVGSRVVQRAQAFGMNVLVCDPPLARTNLEHKSGESSRYRPLKDLLGADYLTLHTPLSREGPEATYHLVDWEILEKIDRKTVLLNTSRGSVVDTEALKSALQAGKLSGAVLDVWEGEPEIDRQLARMALVATSHIAGYSFEGKVNGTMQCYRHLCGWLGVAPEWSAQDRFPSYELAEIELDGLRRSDEEVLREAVARVYPLMQRDDRVFRKALLKNESKTYGEAFEGLRKNYPLRREFSRTTLKLHNASEKLANQLRGLTFKVELTEE